MNDFVEIGILQQRKIEAEIIKPIYDIMKRGKLSQRILKVL